MVEHAAVNTKVRVLPSGLEHLDKLLDDLEGATGALLTLSGVVYDDINADSPVVFIGWNKRQWAPLPDNAPPLVGKARSALQRLRDYSANAARHAPDRAAELDGLYETLERFIEQPNGTYPGGAPKPTIEEIKEYAASTLDECRGVFRRLPSAHGSGERLLVADTSALLDRPDLQNWKLDGDRWTLILLPQVLSELDDRKRDTRTRDAAQKVITQIEEFDRRGDTFAGVPLAGRVTFREVPISPNMDQSLSWLRSDVPDDAIIAGSLELAWRDLTSRVAVAASDRNVRNKARLAGLAPVRPDEL